MKGEETNEGKGKKTTRKGTRGTGNGWKGKGNGAVKKKRKGSNKKRKGKEKVIRRLHGWSRKERKQLERKGVWGREGKRRER